MNAEQYLKRMMERVAVVPESGCWIWTGSTGGAGYGTARWQRKLWRAHRLMFLLHGNELRQGLELDHVCRVKLCVNPRHLEQVTHTENMRRSPVIQAHLERRRTKPFCKHGHERTPDNILRDRHGMGRCRECNILRLRVRNQTRRAA